MLSLIPPVWATSGFRKGMKLKMCPRGGEFEQMLDIEKQ